MRTGPGTALERLLKQFEEACRREPAFPGGWAGTFAPRPSGPVYLGLRARDPKATRTEKVKLGASGLPRFRLAPLGQK
jgi:hypothetical protein